MIDFQTRSDKKELLDGDEIPFIDIEQNLKELNTINSYLGGHSVTIAGLKMILPGFYKKNPVTICEIGCGGGDNLVALAKWFAQKNIKVNFIGIDIRPACIEFARLHCNSINVQWICSDYIQADFNGKKPDVIFSSLFCHHFTEDDLVTMLQWMKTNAEKGFFINDLHRHPLAYYSIKFITSVFSRSYLVKNDAPMSVARGFKRKEWQQLLEWADIKNYSLQWKWAFRHLIISSNG